MCSSDLVVFRRDDGTSVFRPVNSAIFTSEGQLLSEDRLLERSRDLTGPTVSLATVEKLSRNPDADGLVLGEDQAEALTRIAVSGRVLDVLVGPAGAGKTTAMNALRRAWEAEHGTGSVVGLAPSAVAAQVLADDLGIGTDLTQTKPQSHGITGMKNRIFAAGGQIHLTSQPNQGMHTQILLPLNTESSKPVDKA